MVALKDIVQPQQMTLEECAMIAAMRVQENMQQTQHPFHHLTANGVIVDADPTLEYLFGRLKGQSLYRALLQDIDEKARECAAHAADLPQAVPVNRTYYGVNPFAS